MADMLVGFIRQQHEPNPHFVAASSMLNGILTSVIELDADKLKELVAEYPGLAS